MLNVFISTLQIVSVTLTSLLGLASIIYGYKDQDGQITRTGRRLLAGIVCSSVISISSTALQQYKQAQEKEASLKRAMTTIENSNRLLKEVNRSLHPLESVSSAVVVELTDQGGATEVKRLKQQLRAFLAAHLPAHKPEQSTPGVFIGTNVGKHPVINVTDKAKNLYPNPLSYPALHAACTAPVLTVWLCQPRDSKEMVFKLLRPSFLCVASNSDLRMDFEAMISATSLTYEQDTDQLVAEIDFAVVPKHDWENNGLYASVLDIPNSSCLAFLNLYTYPQPAINYNLRVIKLSFSGENFWIEKPKVLVKDDGAFRFISTTLVK